MAQADYVVSNGTGAAVRADLNGQLAAIVTNNSGATSPATTYAYQWWADTTTNTLKLRNSANSAWIEIMQLDGTLTMEDGTAALPGLAFRDDLDTGIFRAGTNQLGISSAGVERVEFGSSEVVFNDAGNNYDFRVEGDTNANLLFVDASADAVGIGDGAPSTNLVLRGTGSSIAGINTHFLISDSTTAASGVGGSVLFEGNYTSGGARAVFGAIAGIKENGTDSNFAGSLRFYTRANGSLPALAMTIDSSQRVGIGTTSPGSALTIGTQGSVLSGTGNNYALYINPTSSGFIYIDALTSSTNNTSLVLRTYNNGTYNNVIQSISGNDTTFSTGGTERARIDSSGRLLVGTSSAATTDNNANAPYIQLEGADGDASRLLVRSNAGTTATAGPVIYLSRSRGTTANSKTSVAADDFLGSIVFEGTDGTADRRAAAITAFVDATPGANDMPGRLVFSTTADGASSPTERMRVTEKGEIQTGNNQGTNNIFRQIARDPGNASETFTATDLGMSDNCTALINISIGGTTGINDYGGCLIYWYMPRGTNSAIQQTIVTAFKGAGITTFSVSASGNSLVVSKDSDQGVFVTVIGGGGTSIF